MVPHKPLIAVICHSGTGGTQALCKALGQRLSSHHQISMHKATKTNPSDVSGADLLVFGFPVIHLEPSRSIIECVERFPTNGPPRKAYAILSKSLISQNTMRAFIKVARTRNIMVGGSAEFRSPASDCTLEFAEKTVELARKLNSSFVYGYEDEVGAKLDRCAEEIAGLIRSTEVACALPPWKAYTPFMWLLQKAVFDQAGVNVAPLRVLGDRCDDCLLCVKACPRGAWSHDPRRGLAIAAPECDRCMRCVHHCPRRAIIYNDAMTDRPRLTLSFHAKAQKAFLDDTPARDF